MDDESERGDGSVSMNEIMWSISSLGNSARGSIMVWDGVGIRG